MSKKHEPGMAYDMKKLNKVFAFLSMVFLMTTFWVFLDDYIRPWKKIQVDAMNIKKEKLAKEIEEEQKKLDKEKLENLNQELVKANELVVLRKNEISEVENLMKLNDRELKNETITNGKLNALVGEVNFNWELAHAKHDSSADKLFTKLKKLKADFASSKDRLKGLSIKEQGFIKKIAELKKELIGTQKSIKKMTQTIDLLKLAKEKVDPASSPFHAAVFALRNAPMVDFLDPTLKINQIVLTDITDDRFFRQVDKVDRCTTCHTFIDEPGYEDQPNPHKTHPSLDLMLGKNSPHPIKKIGCTVCHGGEGHRVNDFNSAAHTPRDEEQKKEWVEKYNWHEPHKVPQPMLKTGMTEAACIKCHKDVQYIPQATVFNEGRKNIEKFGCYGCHKIPGYEHKVMPGPSLKKVASKVTKEFFKNWVWEPKGFNKHARMPQFFAQDNNSRPDFMVKNIAEVNAMAEFIWSISEDYEPFMAYRPGDAENGKKLISEVGCLSCHGVDGLEEETAKVKPYKAPYLSGTGSKVSGDWLVSWLKKPSHYQEDTIMPSFRLSDSEAQDIATYLLSLKNKKFESLKFEALDGKVRDELLLQYFSQFDTQAVASKKLAAMSDHDKTIELGKRSIGKYGCYSCHSIEGFKGRAPIGPDLTKIGSKPLTQFGFGHEHDIEHSRDAWIYAHLINPRRWDNGVDKSFKDVLLMPNFYMTEDESKSITVSLLGLVSDYIPLKGQKMMTKEEKTVAEGMKVAIKYNCIGCHKIDGEYGDLANLYADDDPNMGPPYLMEQGHRVQTEWFHYFLGNVYKIRPWLNVRMPSFNFSNEERNKLVEMFQAKAHQRTFEDNYKAVAWRPGEKEAAWKLFKTLECATCHTQGFNNEEAQAPNLYYASKRLRPSWIKKWFKNPQAILEYTPMPAFWEEGDTPADDEILGGDPEKQMDALVKLLQEIGKEDFHKADRR